MDISREELKAALQEAIMDSSPMALEDHVYHHSWIKMKIVEEQKKKAFWEGIRSKSLPAAIVAFVTAAGASAWAFLTDLFRTHWK